ncbi:MAG: D-arabinose 5-phosphate isomerase [Legionellaceae bacterium]|nr:D-arabinose 5-phosphate isomerase [Legionellaceae bacterium]
MPVSSYNKSAQKVIDIEVEAIQQLSGTLGQSFDEACEILLNCQGRIIVVGMGKSGHIGSKIAATLASTGSPAFFLHPAEASHGDLGMLTKRDVIIAISNSGKTEEVINILPVIKRLGLPMIAITNNKNSQIAHSADTVLELNVKHEACPLNLAPTASTTATLVIGDALAIALLEARGFTKEDFAFAHPGGTLGKRLLLKVEDVMHTGDAIPKVHIDALLSEALVEMTNKRLGMTAIVDNDDTLLGVFTDGDLRRAVEKEVNFKTTPIKDVMTENGVHVTRDMLAVEALHLMEKHKIFPLLVIDEHQKLIGAFNMHDLFKAGVV